MWSSGSLRRTPVLVSVAGTIVLAAGAWLALAKPNGVSPGGGDPATASVSERSFEQAGLRVEMDVAPLAQPEVEVVREGQNVRMRFRVNEAMGGGEPIGGLSPLAWLARRREGEAVPDPAACEYQIRGLLAGRLARSAEVNLNEYLLVTLDDNNSVSIIDPQIESSKTKTLGMVSLTSKGRDFVLSPDRNSALVTLPSQGRVASADLFSRKARYADVGGAPDRIAIQPDGIYAWVGDAEASVVSALRADDLTVQGRIEVGPGPHVFAFREDSGAVYVASPRAEDLVVVDPRQVAGEVGEMARVRVGPGMRGLAYSEHTGKVYVARESGSIEVIEGRSFVASGSIPTEPGLSGFWVSPDGKLGFALHRDAAKLEIIDLPRQRVAHRMATDPEPDGVTFTDTFAYIRHASTGEMLLLDLGVLANGGDPVFAPIPMGQRPPYGKINTVAPTVAALPEGGGALVLNPADRSIYHFMEGMSAPMGSYQTYPWTARGILISDRTIREVEKGVYQTEFKLPRAGVYTVPFLVPTSPQLYGCFNVAVDALPNQPSYNASIELDEGTAAQVFTAGRPQPLRLHLTDTETGGPAEGLEDVMVLVFRGPVWQWRGVAQGTGDGTYQVDVTLPDPGKYQVMVASESRGVEFGQVRSTVVHAVAANASPSVGGKESGR